MDAQAKRCGCPSTSSSRRSVPSPCFRPTPVEVVGHPPSPVDPPWRRVSRPPSSVSSSRSAATSGRVWPATGAAILASTPTRRPRSSKLTCSCLSVCLCDSRSDNTKGCCDRCMSPWRHGDREHTAAMQPSNISGVLVEDPEDGSGKHWDVAAMESYMLERAEEHMALGLLTPDDVVTMRQRKAPDSENGTESAEEESSPSWASSSAGNTPSYGSSGLAFDFGHKCTIAAATTTDNDLVNGSRIPKSNGAQRGSSVNGRRSSGLLRLCGSLSSDQLAGVDGEDSGPDSPGTDWTNFPSTTEKATRKGSADDVPREVQTPGSTSGKLSRLLRRTQSAGCSKDVPAHALFLTEKRPITKTKSADSAPGCERDDVTDRLNKKGRKTLAQDMKLRLSFLRRRHTDTSLQQQPPSVRPSPEEAQKWAHSFNELMNNKYGLALFRAFLSREFCEENIEFWLACEAYKKVRSNKLPSKARKIYNDFIAVQAPKEVNLDPTLRTALMNNLSNPDPHFFDQAQRRIQALLEQDAYMRFLQSDLYTELLCDNSR